MQYLHTMVRVRDLDASLRFYCEGLGLREARRMENDAGRFTLVFLAAAGDAGRGDRAHIELGLGRGLRRARAISATSRSGSRTSTRRARTCSRWASRSTVRRATATWHSCDRRT